MRSCSDLYNESHVLGVTYVMLKTLLKTQPMR